MLLLFSHIGYFLASGTGGVTVTKDTRSHANPLVAAPRRVRNLCSKKFGKKNNKLMVRRRKLYPRSPTLVSYPIRANEAPSAEKRRTNYV